jgi:hypothetical protein
VVGGQLLEGGVHITKQASVLIEEFLCDGLDAEGVFELRQRGEILGVLEQIQEPSLRGVATLALADDVGEPEGRREARLDINFARFGLDRRTRWGWPERTQV